MDDRVYIYALEYPKGNVRYIGKANNFCKRYKRHIRDAMKYTSSHRLAWIRSILNQGDLPYITIVDFVPKSEWEHWEQYYIRKYRKDGYDLVNETIGGDGNFNPPQSVRDKISNSLKEYYKEHPVWNKGTKGVSVGYPKGKKRTKEDAEANSKRKRQYFETHEPWNKGKKMTEEQKKKISEVRKGISSKPKKIEMYDLQGNKITEFNTIREAVSYTGLGRKTVKKYCKGGYSEGFVLKYKDAM